MMTIENNAPLPKGVDFDGYISSQNRLSAEIRAKALKPELTPEQQGAEMVRLAKQAVASGRIRKGVICIVHGANGQVLWTNGPQAGAAQPARGGRAEFEQELQRRMKTPGSPMTEMTIQYPDGTKKTFRR